MHPSGGVDHPPAPRPQKAHALAVYPFLIRSDATPDRAIALGNRLAEQVVRSRRYAVFGPTEFQVHVPDGDAILALTDLATAVPAAGVSIEGLVVLRGWLERHTQSVSRHEGEAEAEQVSVVGHLEAVDAASGQVLAEAATRPGPESQAEMEVDALGKRILDALPNLAQGDEVTPTPLWLTSHSEAAGLRIAQLTPAGAASGLQEGDLVTKVGPVAPTALAVERAERLFAQCAPVLMTVQRAAGEAELQLACGR